MDPYSTLPMANVLTEAFAAQDADKQFVLLIIIMAFTLAAVIILGGMIAGVVASFHKRRAQMDFKREMLDRGMSADEIATVIEATPLPEDGIGRWLAAKGIQKKREQRSGPGSSTSRTNAWRPQATRQH
jgi:hypothetical protein